MKLGDIVLLHLDDDRTLYCQIVRYNGNPGSKAIFLDRFGRAYRDYVSAVVATAEDDDVGYDSEGAISDQAREKTDALLENELIRDGIRAIARKPDSQIISGEVLDTGEYPEPSQGRGHLEAWERPLHMCMGYSSRWSGQLTRYIYWSESEKRHFEQVMEQMRRKRPSQAALFEAIVLKHQRPVEAARELGKDQGNVSRDIRKACEYVNDQMGWNVVGWAVRS